MIYKILNTKSQRHNLLSLSIVVLIIFVSQCLRVDNSYKKSSVNKF